MFQEHQNIRAQNPKALVSVNECLSEKLRQVLGTLNNSLVQKTTYDKGSTFGNHFFIITCALRLNEYDHLDVTCFVVTNKCGIVFDQATPNIQTGNESNVNCFLLAASYFIFFLLIVPQCQHVFLLIKHVLAADVRIYVKFI